MQPRERRTISGWRCLHTVQTEGRKIEGCLSWLLFTLPAKFFFLTTEDRKQQTWGKPWDEVSSRLWDGISLNSFNPQLNHTSAIRKVYARGNFQVMDLPGWFRLEMASTSSLVSRICTTQDWASADGEAGFLGMAHAFTSLSSFSWQDEALGQEELRAPDWEGRSGF